MGEQGKPLRLGASHARREKEASPKLGFRRGGSLFQDTKGIARL